MIDSLTEEKIALLADMIRDKFGLDYSSERWKDLRSAVHRYYHDEDTRFKTSREYLEYIISPALKDSDLEQFINRLTIGETFFFRDSKALKVLEYEILRKLSGMGSGINGAVRIWSAACATGEEPYTLAMICRRSGVRSEIFGTDIDSRALIKAREGYYRKWAFRSEDTGFRDVFFKQMGPNSYLIDPSIRDMVNLSRLNLIDAAVPALLCEMDVILCRNVLMYFSSKGVKSVLDKLWECLKPGGWLLVTPSESALLTNHGRFEPVSMNDCLFFRKNERYEPRCALFQVDRHVADEPDFQPSVSGIDFNDESLEEDISFLPELTTATEKKIDAGAVEKEIETIPAETCIDGAEFLRRAFGLRLQGNLSGAVDTYKLILDQDHDRNTRTSAFLGIAGIKADSGFADEAYMWCERAIELDRMNPGAYFLLGQVHLQLGDRDRALSAMRNAAFLDSGFIMAHVMLGNIYHDNGDRNAAMRYFRIAIQELEKVDQGEPVPFSDGTTSGRLLEMVRLILDDLR
ncbi:CheR family methyltransferase [Maridesulfovibrio sp.]|uniref:CheR family methyltransferase n=1 Tax=Maridesulfovibrio sp. TaxID=2795000 RepID=UPI0029C9EE39|nr:CheR family methyltransferase [Maridesulfovibrio sp.]